MDSVIYLDGDCNVYLFMDSVIYLDGECNVYLFMDSVIYWDGECNVKPVHGLCYLLRWWL